MSLEKLTKWVQLALQDEDLHNYTITSNGTSGKADGFVGNIYFVSVVGEDHQGNPKSLNLAIKASKESQKLHEDFPYLKMLFEKEIEAYTKLKKTFEDLQKEAGVNHALDFLVHCYATENNDISQVLVFEDLKQQGFSSLDKTLSLTLDHARLVLESFGKWHAFSFALKQKKKDVFQEMTKDNLNPTPTLFHRSGLHKLVLEIFNSFRDKAISKDEIHVLERTEFSEKDLDYIFTEMFNEEPEHRVITHEDCWPGNFMFKPSTKPTEVRIIDWQCIGIASPAIDLSHFIYISIDTEKFKDVAELLKIYHDSLSKTLKLLGCDVQKIYPYSLLCKHWKTFSRWGLVMSGFLLKCTLAEAQDTPDFEQKANEGKSFLDNFTFPVSNADEVYRRFRNNLIHYVENLTIT